MSATTACRPRAANGHVKLDLIGRMHGSGWYARTTEVEDVPRIRVEDWRRDG